MSRAINIDATVEDVTASCVKHNIGISSIEPLQSGGTRVVLNNSDDAEKLRRRMKGQIIAGLVVRSGLYMARPPLSQR